MREDLLKTRNDLTVEEIEYLMETESDVKVYKKLIFVRLRAEGLSIIEAYTLANIKRSTAYLIEDQWNEHGYIGLLPKKQKEGSGRKPKLNKKQLKQLSKILKNEKNLTIHKIQELLKNKWNIEYTYMGVKKLLINQFNVDISEYLDYNPKQDINIESFEKNLDNLDPEDKKEAERIINLINNEKDVFVYRKLLSLLFQKLNFTLEFIGQIIGVTKETLITWNNQWIENEYEGLLKKKGQGRKSKLTDSEWEEIGKVIGKRNDWMLPEIAYLIKENYGVEYSFAHLARLLKRTKRTLCKTIHKRL